MDVDELKLWWEGLDNEWKRVFKDNLEFDDSPAVRDLIRVLNTKKLFMQVSSDMEPDFEDYNIDCLEPLKDLLSLENLIIQGNVSKVRSLEPLKNSFKLKHLSITGTSVNDLRPIRNLINLQSISISNTKIIDIGPLSNLKNLKTVTAINCDIQSWAPLYLLPFLENVDIWGDKENEEMAENFRKARPNCEVNRLKQAFDEVDRLNSQELKDPHVEKWTYENAPDEVREQMIEIHDFISYGLNDYWLDALGSDNQTNLRVRIKIENEDYFIIADYIDGDFRPALISNSYWSFWI